MQIIRGATLILRMSPHSQRDTNISPAADVCLTLQHTQEFSLSLHPQRPI